MTHLSKNNCDRKGGVDAPLLAECGLVPIRLDGSGWFRLVVWSNDLNSSFVIPSKSVAVSHLVQAGGGRALNALEQGLKIKKLREETARVCHEMILAEVNAEQRRRGVI